MADPETFRALAGAAVWAPSSHNTQPRRFRHVAVIAPVRVPPPTELLLTRRTCPKTVKALVSELTRASPHGVGDGARTRE